MLSWLKKKQVLEEDPSLPNHFITKLDEVYESMAKWAGQRNFSLLSRWFEKKPINILKVFVEQNPYTFSLQDSKFRELYWDVIEGDYEDCMADPNNEMTVQVSIVYEHGRYSVGCGVDFSQRWRFYIDDDGYPIIIGLEMFDALVNV